MIHHSKLIVLNTTKLGEKAVVVHTLSPQFGRRGFLVSVGSKSSMALFLPLNILDSEVVENPKSDLWRLRNIRAEHSLSGIRGNIYKNSMTLFMSEVLYRAVKDGQGDEELFDWCERSILTLDSLEGNFPNYHLRFLLELCSVLGFAPGSSAAILSLGSSASVLASGSSASVFSPGYSAAVLASGSAASGYPVGTTATSSDADPSGVPSRTPGSFVSTESSGAPSRAHSVLVPGTAVSGVTGYCGHVDDRSLSALIDQLLNASFADFMVFPLSGDLRSEIATLLLKYIGYHAESSMQIRSLPILHELLR